MDAKILAQQRRRASQTEEQRAEQRRINTERRRNARQRLTQEQRHRSQQQNTVIYIFEALDRSSRVLSKTSGPNLKIFNN